MLSDFKNHPTNRQRDQIIEQRIRALIQYKDDPLILLDKLDELQYFNNQRLDR